MENENLESHNLTQTESQTSTITETQLQKETKPGLEGLADLPRIEDLLRSETEVKPTPKIQGLKMADVANSPEDKPFKMQKDEKKALVKKRVKVLTTVYLSVACLLLTFVFGNAITLAVLSNKINSNTDTMQNRSEMVELLEKSAQNNQPDVAGSYEIKLNEPRDYSDDTKELTFFDKLTILFRNLFG